MLPDFARGSILWESIFAAGILLASLVAAWLVNFTMSTVVKQLTKKTKTTLDDRLLDAFHRPLFIFILAHGFFLALTSTTFLDKWQIYVNKAWVVCVLIVVIYGVQRVATALIRWYGDEIAVKTKSNLDEKLLPLVRRFSTVLIYVIGGLVILDNVGIKLSPLLAGLGIGGIAVALALQPTLSSLMAGAFVAADGTLGAGDFIELLNGPNGKVLEIGWRTTRILTPTGNLVVVPNSKLVDSIVTNYYSPTPEMSVVIPCGVSYESDLNQVERVCIEVARQVMNDLPESVIVKTAEPIVRFREFGDSNINFNIILRARDWGNTIVVTHEYMKRLHARFGQERIEMNYPVRKLVYVRERNSKKPVPMEKSHRQEG